MGDGKDKKKGRHGFKIGHEGFAGQQFRNEQIHDALYHDQKCIVCLKKLEVRAANNGWMHKECEASANTGGFVYPKPSMEPVALDADGQEIAVELGEKLLASIMEPF